MRATFGKIVVKGNEGRDAVDLSGYANLGYGLYWFTLGRNDKLVGTIYDDTFTLGQDKEYIDGNAGWDTVIYADSTGGVSVDLNNTTQHGGFAEGDQLVR